MAETAELSKEAIEQNKRKLQKEYEERLKKETQAQKVKEFFILIFVICVFGGGGFYYLSKFLKSSYGNLEHLTKLNMTTLEISQLIDNIRQVYTIYNHEQALTSEQLIERGAIPERLIAVEHGKKVIKNQYGGNIVILPSEPLVNIKKRQSSPTFKMSYQGLSHRTCVALAVMDWGDKLKGLLAVAIGHTDIRTGKDTALTDIDKKPGEEEPMEFVDKNGRHRMVRPRNQYRMNVTKPGDEFLPTPFTQYNAKAGCSCGRQNNCTFALRYTIFAVEDENETKQ